ncbi:bifunctional phosphoribosyl-AMP cyclohydrolase/phosphoribosyl-ATP diphosphatase HisIE [Candidatus Xianfuyuplasma coldseepsis]|uniref:Histidine biosynthesis bifunctional protein HisIE n=1 Tax=Candidatus Xianfuyuplasma coldseepsis TaxID=2782163 RepID=A0A7L7KRF1_9MOLU|nr:bifunctional phosphoribosyl-AMP cyclohydrolase/phosphoribosyl-ATP diphosphatase HisIE [Xianfuyuplasma coldseepsis]QMS84786.1 bifunctional phosphoribosyl-AMP cyclohydrolase/phosphoribosyl-ATP diphosphatase HisIE [Xianfuyuplasma coldseepsis]
MNITFNKEELVPVIVQDYRTGEVLMLAYMNQEAYDKTVETNDMYYFSRSRQTLWRKGETSGNTQRLVSLSYDCDQDTLLAVVNQTGPACHTGNKSCFYRSVVGELETRQDPLVALYDTIQAKQRNPDEGYTSYLFDKGLDKILKKVGEETSEVIIASKNNNEETIYEISDLFYHVLVLMANQGITLPDIYKELASRRK